MIEPLYIQIAKKEIGVTEIPGARHNPRIVEYHQACNLHAQDDETAWCAAYVNWCLKKAGLPGTNKASAISFATYGEDCELQLYCIVVFGKHDPDAKGTGHVGFCVGMEGEEVLVLGGNQGNKVCIAKRNKKDIIACRSTV